MLKYILIIGISLIALFISIFFWLGLKDKNISTAYSQCHIDSFGQAGMNFQSNFPKRLSTIGKNEDDDAAYRNWMLICMEAKGYNFYAPFTKTECWDGIVSNILNKDCFY